MVAFRVGIRDLGLHRWILGSESLLKDFSYPISTNGERVLVASAEFIVCLPAGFLVWNLQQYTFFSRIASWGGYKNAPYRNHGPVLHSRQSTTSNMDPVPGPQNQNETNERRD